MALPTDIVALFYSGSVNIGANNSQSLAPNLTPVLLIQQGDSRKNIDKRLFQKIDNVFKSFSGLNEVIVLYELLVHKVTPKIATETITVSDSRVIKPRRISTETITISESAIKRLISRTVLGTVTLLDNILRKAKPKIATQTVAISDMITKGPHIIFIETVTISASLVHKIARLISLQTITISQLFKRFPKQTLPETITIVENTLGRKSFPNISAEIATISDLLILTVIPEIEEVIGISELLTGIKAKLFVHFAEPTIALGDAVIKMLKAKRTMIEGRCSILFNGLGSA